MMYINVLIIRERGVCACGLECRYVSVPVIVCVSKRISYHIYDGKDTTNTIIPERGKADKNFSWERRKIVSA
jgi:hypothetical protein